MIRTDPDVLTAIADFDTPSVFNAVRTLLGGGPEGEGLEHEGGVPVNYTDHTMKAMLPELGMAVGYATHVRLPRTIGTSPTSPGTATTTTWTQPPDRP